MKIYFKTKTMCYCRWPIISQILSFRFFMVLDAGWMPVYSKPVNKYLTKGSRRQGYKIVWVAALWLKCFDLQGAHLQLCSFTILLIFSCARTCSKISQNHICSMMMVKNPVFSCGYWEQLQMSALWWNLMWFFEKLTLGLVEGLHCSNEAMSWWMMASVFLLSQIRLRSMVVR